MQIKGRTIRETVRCYQRKIILDGVDVTPPEGTAFKFKAEHAAHVLVKQIIMDDGQVGAEYKWFSYKTMNSHSWQEEGW